MSDQPFGQGLLAVSIPEKRYFKIGEVCKITGLKQHVVRYWESEFKQFIRPQRASSKQRLYRRMDIENLLRLQKLLKEDGLTISGARKFLASQRDSIEILAKSQVPSATPLPDSAPLLHEIKNDLVSVLRILDGHK
ncbi:MAG: MerR family transcriptional regulator [Desulfurivibrionaceae bacterium]|nr:MerR family transcriptional regulator [Desulfurivibrionaceae bacterium]